MSVVPLRFLGCLLLVSTFVGCDASDAGPAGAEPENEEGLEGTAGTPIVPVGPFTTPFAPGQMAPDDTTSDAFGTGRRALSWTWAAKAGDVLGVRVTGQAGLDTVLKIYESPPALTSDPAKWRNDNCDASSLNPCVNLTPTTSTTLHVVVHRKDLLGSGTFSLRIECTRTGDVDCDGVPTAEDCNDMNPRTGSRTLDADCDGVPALDDCDDANALAPRRSLDADCDRVPAGRDCNDANSADVDCNGKPDPVGYQVIPAGSFLMGVPEAEVGRMEAAGQVSVSLTKDFWVKELEVTRGEWKRVGGITAACPNGCLPTTTVPCMLNGVTANSDDCPVSGLTWWSALEYANALSIAEGLETCYSFSARPDTGLPCAGNWRDGTLDCGTAMPLARGPNGGETCYGYRLPTEAEWEYAARAQTVTATYGGDLAAATGCTSLLGAGTLPSGTNLQAIANYNCGVGLTGVHVQPGRRLLPNAWGLFHMLGNVWEWTWSTDRASRGGSHRDAAGFIRAGSRSPAGAALRSDGIGFRLVRTIPWPPITVPGWGG
jgi:formylglycine-generating enzyme required for sulfatase activity